MTKVAKYNGLIEQIVALVQQSKQQVARSVNQTITLTYWQIGRYIVEFEQAGEKRAEYGKELLRNLSKDLTEKFGKGFSYRNLQLFKKFYHTFPIVQSVIAQSENRILQSPIEESNDENWQTPSAKTNEEIEQTPSAQLEKQIWQSPIAKYNNPIEVDFLLKLSWTHLVRLMSIKSEEERIYYLKEAIENNWSVRELDRQINSALYERQLLNSKKLSKKNEATTENITRFLKDPYVLEFLDLKESASYSESDLETAIINNLELFLLELGKGFSFVARQYRISSDADHFRIDLVFYNRLLRAHVLFDLKIGKLKHQDIGQMQMYVNYFDREIKTDFENPTIGIILCKEKNDFVVEYSLPINNSQIYPKEYQLYLPNKEELKALLKKYL